MFNKKEIAELNERLAELKERLDALESSVNIYPTKGVLGYLPTSMPINQVVQEIVNHLELDILAVQPTRKKVELKPKQVPPTISTGKMK
jgi:hypothetical protein